MKIYSYFSFSNNKWVTTITRNQTLFAKICLRFEFFYILFVLIQKNNNNKSRSNCLWPTFDQPHERRNVMSVPECVSGHGHISLCVTVTV